MKNTTLVLSALAIGFILMSGVIDLNNLFDYENQSTPNYLSKDNTPLDNPITNAGATLGRVLFYDKSLSSDNTISCGSCHLQEFAFGDTALVSTGVNGLTGRHSMRLINPRYSEEVNAFWDERANSFEDQSTQPIQDHIEMGYSGTNGDGDFDDLITKLDGVDYYNTLFQLVYGDTLISEERIQKAIAQFIRSIESYDSKFDIGRAQVTNNTTDFPNFTAQENEGKSLFFTHPPAGGAGCDRCHGGTEFSMIADCNNNGVLGVANDTSATDTTVTKAPTLRDLVNPQGLVNGPFMHNGSLATLTDVVNHYNDLVEVPNSNLDFRLAGPMHDLSLTQGQIDAITAFLNTLTGDAVYTAEQWSDPFDAQGNISISEITAVAEKISNSFFVELYPNPTQDRLNIRLAEGNYQLSIYDINGKLVKSTFINGNYTADISELPSGIFVVDIMNKETKTSEIKRISKR